MNYLIDKKFRSKILDELFRVFKIKEKVNEFYMNRSDIKYLKTWNDYRVSCAFPSNIVKD